MRFLCFVLPPSILFGCGARYNVQADLPQPLPPVLHPGTKQPVGPDDLAPLFPMALILQEVSQDRYIEIPEVPARGLGCVGRRAGPQGPTTALANCSSAARPYSRRRQRSYGRRAH